MSQVHAKQIAPSGATNGQLLRYNFSTGSWEPYTYPGSDAITLANLSNALNSGAYPLQMKSGVADGASAVGYILDTTNALANTTAKAFEIRNAGASKFTVFADGGVTVKGVLRAEAAICLCNSVTYNYYDYAEHRSEFYRCGGLIVEGTLAKTNLPPDDSWGYNQLVVNKLDTEDGIWWDGGANEGAGEYMGYCWLVTLPANILPANYTKFYAQVIGYNTNTTTELRIYNWHTAAWEHLADGTSQVANNNMSGEVTTNASYYIDVNGRVGFSIRTKTSPTTSGVHIYADYVRLGWCANVELIDKHWKGSLQVDGDFLVNGNYRPSSLISLDDAMYDLGSIALRWNNAFLVNGFLDYLDVNGSFAGMSEQNVYLHGTNGSAYQVALQYESSRAGSDFMQFLEQTYLATGTFSEADTRLWGDVVMLEKTGGLIGQHLRMLAHGSIAYFHPTTGIATGAPILVQGGYSLAYGKVSGTENTSDTVNLVSHLFDLPTSLDDGDGGSFTGTVNKLAWLALGDMAVATGTKLYFNSALSGVALTLGASYLDFGSGLLKLHVAATELGSASTDTITAVGRFIPRSVASDPTAVATAGTLGEIVRNANKWYGKTVGTGTDTNWSALN